ncbi:hypothetical protein Mycsm_07020 (plasmid) [Mycobacterium sp. JS623]|nr:hypothetical protein Mycsm_07020 [Mycobacterium sp. JS623]
MIDFVATTVDAELILAQERPGSPFVATLSRTETRWYADGYRESVDAVIATCTLRAPLPVVFEMVNEWLLAEHQHAVLPLSWQFDSTDTDNAVAFNGRVAPAQLAHHVESAQSA